MCIKLNETYIWRDAYLQHLSAFSALALNFVKFLSIVHHAKNMYMIYNLYLKCFKCSVYLILSFM